MGKYIKRMGSVAIGTLTRYFKLPNSAKKKCDFDDYHWCEKRASKTATMISRKKIISKSCDELTICESDLSVESDEDIWFQKDKLYQDHIQEILLKWDQIDDEIWSKIICLEKNRRVAKAYARVPLLTICGSNEGFDGYKIGLSGFENPSRDARTEEVIKSVGKGVRIRMDEEGNILAKRIDKCPVMVKEWHSELLEPYSSCISDDVISAKGKLETEKSIKIFDMQKFQRNIAHEMKDAYPDRRKLERQCITAVAFGKNASELLDVPCWVMIINIVALEVLKSKLLPTASGKRSNVSLSSIFNPLLYKIKDEDLYVVTNSSSTSEGRDERHADGRSQRRSSRPKKDLSLIEYYRRAKHLDSRSVQVPTPDYDTDSTSSPSPPSTRISDPYYSGFIARVPDFGSHKKRWKQYKGYLNSVMRLLPIQANTALRKSSSSSSSFPIDSDDIYGHIYSSISDSKGGANGSIQKMKFNRSTKLTPKPKTAIAV